MVKFRLASALVLALSLVGSGAHATEPVRTPLLEALAFVPAGEDPDGLQFVDWAQLKELHGGAEVTGTSPLAERQRLLLDIVRAEAAPMYLGLDRSTAWRDVWGWDSTDLEWEARVYGQMVVFRFGRHWDAGPFREALEGFGYAAHDFGAGTAYQPDSGAEVPPQLRFANMHGLDIHGRAITEPMVRVAISDDGHTVVLGKADGVERFLVAGLGADPAGVATDGLGRAAAALGRPLAASILDGRITCSERTNGWLMGEARAVAASVSPLHRYEALAVGYTRSAASEPPRGRYAFAYRDPVRAQADLDGRRVLVDEGYPLNDGVNRYEDVAFSRVDWHVADSGLILDVAPLGGAPELVFRQVQMTPTLFAICGPMPGPVA